MNGIPPCCIQLQQGGISMEITHPIMLEDRSVGMAEVNREGLYYHFRCICCLPKDHRYMILVNCGGMQQSLGVCTPREDGLGLEKRLPVKRVGDGRLEFQAVLKESESQGDFYPVNRGKPFLYISQLPKAYFTIHNGQAGIVIKDR